MVDGSKLLGSGDKVDSELRDKLALPVCFQAHSGMHELSMQLCQQLSQDINADYPSLFNEKKNRELQQIASLSQETILAQVKAQAEPLFRQIKTALRLSLTRREALSG